MKCFKYLRWGLIFCMKLDPICMKDIPSVKHAWSICMQGLKHPSPFRGKYKGCKTHTYKHTHTHTHTHTHIHTQSARTLCSPILHWDPQYSFVREDHLPFTSLKSLIFRISKHHKNTMNSSTTPLKFHLSHWKLGWKKIQNFYTYISNEAKRLKKDYN